MNNSRLMAKIILCVVFASGLAACGPQKVDVTLKSYGIELSANTVSAGNVVFHVSNVATDQMHEFVIFKTDLPEDQLPRTVDGNVDEEGAGVTHIDEVADMAVGQVSDLTVKLGRGRYVLVCNLTENSMHYMAGMHIVFTVN